MKAGPHIPLNFLNVVVSVVFCLNTSFSYAQPAREKATENSYRAVHWTIYDGLSQAETYYILKDVNGFVWIGTKNGLNRFDGNLFKNYYHDPHDKNTIAGSYILGLVEDSLHNIWIGSSRGLSRYDIKADTFSNFIPDKNSPDHSIEPFWATRDKLYALESGLQITVYDIHSFAKKSLVNLTAADSVDAGPSAAYAIFDKRSNSIWMLRGYDNPGGGLLNVSLTDRKKVYYKWPCYLKKPGHNHSSEAMRYDPKRNAIWINSPDGLMEFTLADKQFHHIDAMDDLLKLKNYHRFVGIDLDLKGRVWLATDPKGIQIYDPSNQSLSIPFPEDSVMQHDVSDANAVIYCDKDGITWLGTWLRKGFYQLLPFSPAAKLYTPNPKRPLGFFENEVINVVKGKSGKLWVGTFNGLFEFNKQSGELRALDNKDFPGLKVNKAIVPDFIDPDLNIAWIATDAGYFEMDMKTQICRPVIFKDSLGKPLNIGAPAIFFPFKNRWIIFGTYNNKGFIFTGNGDNLTAREAVSIPNNFTNITADRDHLLFIKRDEKTSNLTFSYINGKLSRIHHKMDSLQWTNIFFNKKDRTYWVAASKQIIHYDNNFKMIRAYGHENGLPDIAIAALIADNAGNIWFHTDHTIHQLNVATGEVSTLTEKDGFEKQDFFLLNNNYKDDDGDIYLPGGVFGSGFNRIKPGKFTNPPSSLYLQSLEVNQQPFPLPTGINNLRELSLRYFENKLTLETGIIDYYSKGSSHMRYKLEREGANENWQYGPANYTIRFEGLQPGKYKLTMQASNAALQFNGPEKLLFINIVPAVWDQWWFRIIILAIAALIIISIFRARVKKIKEDAFIQNQLKEMEMKALKAQMNPHFIYNALNSIQALVANDKKDEGIRYIGSFSRLLRQVLDNSENNVITLDKELETIGLYIQLESLRLDVQLQYKKIIPENIVPEFEKIPPLILQPFVENALWHGLSRKAGDKEIRITVSLNTEWLICDIQDNGIGREKAEEWKNNSVAIHQSKGLDITRKRLIDFNENELVTPIEFFDLYDDYKNPAGTLVTVRIKRKFNSISV